MEHQKPSELTVVGIGASAGKEELQSINEELSTVNQELKTKVDEISRVNTDLQNFLAAIDIGTIFLDRSLRIMHYTPRAQEVVNLIPSDLNRPLAHVTHQLAYDDIVGDAEQVLDRLATIERTVQHRDGRWYLARLLPYRTVEDRIDGVVLTFVDITERKRNEESLEQSRQRLQASEELLSLLNQNLHDYAIIMIDPQGNILDWNIGAERMFGYTADEITGQNGKQLFTPEDVASDVPQRERDKAAVVGSAEDKRWHIRKDGTRFWVSGVTTALRDEKGHLRAFAKVARDMTEDMQAEEELRQARDQLEERVQERTRELAEANEQLRAEVLQRQQLEKGRQHLMRQLVTTQEDERKRISRELHDQMGQQLTAMLLGLERLKADSHGRHGSLKVLEQLQSIADAIGQEVHQLALMLRPTSLDDLGLVAVLSNYTDEWARRTQIDVAFHTNGLIGIRLPPEIETMIYRVVLETLNNVLKHAQATNVSLILERLDHEARAIVEDNGQGFDAEALFNAPEATGGLGLLGMQERVALVGGTLTIESTPGSGTTLFVRIPLAMDV